MSRSLMMRLGMLSMPLVVACGESSSTSSTMIDTRQATLHLDTSDQNVLLNQVSPGVFESSGLGSRYALFVGKSGLAEVQRELQRQYHQAGNDLSLSAKLAKHLVELQETLRLPSNPETFEVRCTPRPRANVFGDLTATASVYGIFSPHVPPDDSWVSVSVSTRFGGAATCADKQLCAQSAPCGSGTGFANAYAWMKCIDPATGTPVYFTASDSGSCPVKQ